MKPGETGKIEAIVDLNKRIGRVSKSIVVHTNDPKRPQVNLTLIVNVVQTK